MQIEMKTALMTIGIRNQNQLRGLPTRRILPPASRTPTPPEIFFFPTDFLQAISFSAKYGILDRRPFHILVRRFQSAAKSRPRPLAACCA